VPIQTCEAVQERDAVGQSREQRFARRDRLVTALIAASVGNRQAVRQLIVRHADTGLTNAEGETALSLTTEFQEPDR